MFPVVAGWNPLILVSPAVLAGYGRVVFVAVCLTVIALGVTLAARRALAGVIVIGLVFFAGISQVLARVSGQLDAVFSPYSAARNMVFFSSPAPVEPPPDLGYGAGGARAPGLGGGRCRAGRMGRVGQGCPVSAKHAGGVAEAGQLKAGDISWHGVMRAEMTKILTDPVTWRALAWALVVNVALYALAASNLRLATSSGPPAPLWRIAPLMFAPVYVFLVIPVYAAAGEYVSGQMRISLAAVPDRRLLAAGKLAAAGLLVVPGALLAVGPGRVILALSQGLGLTAAAADVVRWTVAYSLMAAVAYSLGVLLRNRVTPLAILIMVPLMVSTGILPADWLGVIKLMPDQLSMNIAGAPYNESVAMHPPAALGIMLIWAAVMLIAQAAGVLRRDA